MNDSDNVKRGEYLLKSLLFDPAMSAQLKEFAWPSEVDRWYELVFALFKQVCDQSEQELRKLVNYLGNMGHLQIGHLAGISLVGEIVDPTDEEARKTLAILRSKGISDEKAQKALTVLCQMARGLEAAHGGKIQRYLRAYGEAMLEDSPQIFSFTGISSDEVRNVFIYWLQSVANMPLSLQSTKVGVFCHKQGITSDDLFQAADNLDVNFSVVDDLIALAEAAELQKNSEIEEQR